MSYLALFHLHMHNVRFVNNTAYIQCGGLVIDATALDLSGGHCAQYRMQHDEVIVLDVVRSSKQGSSVISRPCSKAPMLSRCQPKKSGCAAIDKVLALR